MFIFAKERGGGTPPVPLEPSKKLQFCSFLLFIGVSSSGYATLCDCFVSVLFACSFIICKNQPFFVYLKNVYNFVVGRMRGDSKRDSTSVATTKKTPSKTTRLPGWFWYF